MLAFDLLHLNGRTFRKTATSAARLSKSLRVDIVFSSSCRVLRRRHSGSCGCRIGRCREASRLPIRAGKRSGVWQKFKVKLRQEFVIGGYKPENRNFQSIVVGYYENKKLRFAARVRSGFTPPQRTALFELLRPLRVGECPFTDLPSTRTGHWGDGVTVEDMKVLKWVKPVLVAEIAFTEWTRDGNLRHSAFVGMRTDKNARAVVREHSVRPQILEEP
jgi:bifunctional non-homologous end joining protein LigD